MARVNHFLHLLETGKPKDAKYITDNDLLPEGHPAIVEKQESFKPPKAVRDAAARGLALRREWGRGGLSVQQAAEQGLGSGVQRAVNLKNGDNITLETVGRMRSFFARHQVNNRPNKKMPDGGPTAGTIAWLLWGGDPGKQWADEIWSKYKMEKQELPAHFGGGKNIKVFDYETQHFDICKSAVLLFERLTKEAASEKASIVAAAQHMDKFFELEKKVVMGGTASIEDSLKALDLISLFAYELGRVSLGSSLDLSRDFSFVKMHFYEIGRRMSPEKVTEKRNYEIQVARSNADIAWTMPIIKRDDEERIVTGIVLEPDTVDAQGDIVSPDTIKEAAYSFLKRYNKKTQLGIMHKMFGNLGISLVESWVAKTDQAMNDKHIKKGSWLMSIRVDDNEKLWEKCKRGEITGFSIGGTAKVS